MKRKNAVFNAVTAGMFVLLSPAAPTLAAVPELINFQGKLTDPGDNAVTSAVSMVFKFYTASAGGAPVWTETQTVTPDKNGIYSVILGEVSPFNVNFSTAYWLGVTVGTDSEMLPRYKIVSSAYSLYAATAAWAGGADWPTITNKSSVTVQGNVFGGPGQLVQLLMDGKLPVLNGSNLTDLPVAGIPSGASGNLMISDGTVWTSAAVPTWNQSTTGNAATATTLTGLSATVANLNTVTGALGTAAFTASGAYATAAQGTLAANALPSASFTDAAVTGKLLTGYTGVAGTVDAADSVLGAINKLSGNIAAKGDGTVTGVTGTAPVASSGGTAPVISMAAASSGVNGYMTGVYAAKLDGIAAGANLYVHPNHSGDVVSTGDGVQTIAAKAVTLSKMDDMATASLLYRRTGGAGAPEVNSLATLKADLGLSGTNSGDITAGAAGNLMISDGTVWTSAAVPTWNQSTTGNAATATALATARDINGVSFDGTANISITDATKVPTTRTVNGHALSADVTVTQGDIGLGNVTNDAQIAKAIGTSKGDLIAFTGSAAPVRVPAGADGQIIMADSAQAAGVKWAPPGGDAYLSSTQTFTGLNTFTSTITAKGFANASQTVVINGEASFAADGSGLVRITVAATSSVGTITGCASGAVGQGQRVTFVVANWTAGGVTFTNTPSPPTANDIMVLAAAWVTGAAATSSGSTITLLCTTVNSKKVWVEIGRSISS